MKKICIEKILNKRSKIIENPDLSYNYTHDIQIIFINKVYLDLSFNEKSSIIKELKSKHNSYRTQDIEKEIYDSNTFIIMEEMVEKIVSSKLLCFYCKQKLQILYENAREPFQWTLDRKNNNLNHSDENTVICCLKCNLERRKKNMEAFRFTKQLKIVKQNT